MTARRSGGRGWALLGLTPFSAYVVLFLAVPTVLALGTGFFDGDGALTLDNLTGLFEPAVLRSFADLLWLSGLTAVVGAIAGALICFALLGTREDGWLRTGISAASGVLAQFGGVMLAFAFIALIGIQGLLTQWLLRTFEVDIYEGGVWLYQVPGLILPYLYFQIPLMVITFMPAMSGLKPQWAEASATLGGTGAVFWWRIGFPVLAPSFLGSLLLLFANAFSSYGTAAALVSQGAPIVPLQVRAALISETVLGRENMAGALAIGMIVVMVVLMTAYSALQSRAERWMR